MGDQSEKFCLKWNDFNQNIQISYKDLRTNSDFFDVTLLCEEDQQIEAHKIILSACSPFFSSVLKRTNQSHPMIYMRGLKASDLVAIVDFIYYGEANIYQDDLDGFLALAEELQLKGLAGFQNDIIKKSPAFRKTKWKTPNENTRTNETIDSNKDQYSDKYFNAADMENKFMVSEAKMVLASNVTENELALQIQTMMEKVDDGENSWRCTVCQKETRGNRAARDNMKRHIETHIEGLSYPCNLCGKISRSSSALNMHVFRHHKKP